MKKIEIFRPGRHTALSGEEADFSESHLRQTAEAYDPAVHEAPIVVGHPRAETPAYGWIKGVSFAEDRNALEAEPDQVDPAFAEQVAAGRYKKVSASFYRPDSKNNPKPGVYYLRHVGFLGAQPPSVKGLKPVEFSEADADVIELEFGEAEKRLSSVLRRIREFVIEVAGLKKADQVLPEYEIQSLETAGQEAAEAEYSEREGDELSIEQQREKIRKEVEAEFAEREQKLAKEEKKRRRQAHEQAAEKLVEAGKVLPRHKDGLVEFMEAVDTDQATVEFAEEDGGDPKKLPPVQWLEKFLTDLPQAVDYAERGGGEGEDDIAAYQAPDGYSVDPEKARLHAQALEYQEKNDCDYVTAVFAVAKHKSK